MEHVRDPLKTATLGMDQRYQPLHIRQVQTEDGAPCQQSLWRPSVEEIDALAKGAVIALFVLGHGHPPVMLDVVQDPLSAVPGLSAEPLVKPDYSEPDSSEGHSQ